MSSDSFVKTGIDHKDMDETDENNSYTDWDTKQMIWVIIIIIY